MGGEAGKKSRVVVTMATVGPAARKLHMRMATQTRTAMHFLYHCGLRAVRSLRHAKSIDRLVACRFDSPVQGVIGIIGRRWNEDDLVGLVVSKANVAECPLPYVFGLWILEIVGA